MSEQGDEILEKVKISEHNAVLGVPFLKLLHSDVVPRISTFTKCVCVVVTFSRLAINQERSYMFEERLETAERLRQLGNDRFSKGRMEEAAEAYQRALYHVDFDELQVNFDFNDGHRASLKTSKVPILLNLCQCLSKLGGSVGRSENFGRATHYAGQAIELDATCAKAWFWRGKARMETGDLEGSATDLAEASKLVPRDKNVRLAMQSLKMKQREVAEARKNMWRGKLRGSASASPGRRQVQEAAAWARGEAGGNPRKGRQGQGWGLIVLATLGG